MYMAHTNREAHLTLEAKRSNVNIELSFEQFWLISYPPLQRLGPSAYLVMEKKIFKGFYHIWAWQPFWSMDHTLFSNLSFSCPWRLCIKFEQHWPGGFRGKAIWNYQHFVHTNVWGPYKCKQNQTWPRRKKVKCQCMTIILATLVDRPFQMIHAKIQPQAILGFGE